MPDREEVAPMMVYDRKRIAWELERTAMGDGFYGNALRVAKDLPEATPEVKSLLDRWATGAQEGLSDRTDLCAFALQVHVSTPDESVEVKGFDEWYDEYTKNNYTDEMLALAAWKQALAQQPAAVGEAATNSAVAAIQFAMTDSEGMTFLRLWMEGEFAILRREWPDAPVEVYSAADPLTASQPSKEPPMSDKLYIDGIGRRHRRRTGGTQ